MWEWLVLSALMNDENEEQMESDSESMLIGNLFDEEDIEPINFICKDCGHSYDEHKNIKCDHGVFRKCECSHFILNNEQVEQAKKELMQIEGRLLENYKEALRLNNS